MTTMTIEEACEIAYGYNWRTKSVPINTIHCTACGVGMDMPGGNKDGMDFSYEEKECPSCEELIEVTVRAKGKIPF